MWPWKGGWARYGSTNSCFLPLWNDMPAGATISLLGGGVEFFNWTHCLFPVCRTYFSLSQVKYLLCLPSIRGRYIALLLTAHFYVTSVLCLCVLSVSVRSLHLSCRRSNMRCWPNVGLLLAHRLRPPTLAQYWVTVSCRVRRHAECGPASKTAGQH